LAFSEQTARVELDLTLLDTSEGIGVDCAVAIVISDEQVAAELAPTLGRDREAKGRIQMHACRIRDQPGDQLAVRAEFIHEPA